jgi:hypothetical protein
MILTMIKLFRKNIMLYFILDYGYFLIYFILDYGYFLIYSHLSNIGYN